jgi:hypothetical protein
MLRLRGSPRKRSVRPAPSSLRVTMDIKEAGTGTELDQEGRCARSKAERGGRCRVSLGARCMPDQPGDRIHQPPPSRR